MKGGAVGRGGYRAWIAAQLFFVLGVLATTAFAILSADIAARLKLGAADLGTLGGVFFVAYAAGQLVLGVLIGRLPARHVLGLTALLSAMGAVVFGLADGMAMAVAGRVLMGLGFATTFVGVLYIVARDFADRFAFLSALSQSIVNLAAVALGLASVLLPVLADFRLVFLGLAVLLLVSALLIWLLVDERADSATGGARGSVADALRVVASRGQFWVAVVYYCGTFGTLLAFADLWNVQFQATFFGYTAAASAALNLTIPLGVTLGSLAAGWWALRAGFVRPARGSALLTLAGFVALWLAPLSTAGAAATLFAIGVGLAGSTLGLAAVQAHLAGPVAPIATSLVVTAAYLYGGLIQPLVGVAVGGPAGSGFEDYRRGLLWLLASVTAAAVASFLFRGLDRAPPARP